MRFVPFFIVFIFSSNFTCIAQNTIWNDSCISNTFIGNIQSTAAKKQWLSKDHFILPNKDVLVLSNLRIKSPIDPTEDDSRVLIQRISEKGDSIWSKYLIPQAFPLDTSTLYHSACITGDGHLIVVLQSIQLPSYGPIFIKMNIATQTIVWSKQINYLTGAAAGSFYVSSIKEDDNKNIIAVGSALFNGWVIALHGSTGNMIFEKQYIEFDTYLTSFNDVAYLAGKYYVLGGSSNSNYSSTYIFPIDVNTGDRLGRSFRFDSTQTLGLYYNQVDVINNELWLVGNYFNNANTAYYTNETLSFLKIDTFGNTITSKKLISTASQNNSIFNWNDTKRFDWKTNIGCSLKAATNSPNSKDSAVIFKVNSDLTQLEWANSIATPDNAITIAISSSIDHGSYLGIGHYSNLGILDYVVNKTDQIGELGNCSGANEQYYFEQQAVTITKSPIVLATGVIIPTELNVPMLVVDTYGKAWQTTCTQVKTCRVSKMIGKNTICIGDTTEYKIKLSDDCRFKTTLFNFNTNNIAIIKITDSSVTIKALAAGSVRIESITKTICGNVIDSLIVNIQTINKPIISPRLTSICPSQIQPLSVAANYVTYAWSNGSVSNSTNISDTGKYIIRVQDIYGCEASDSIFILNRNPIPNNFLSNDTVVCKYLPLQITPIQNLFQHNWSNGANTPSIKIILPGTYWLSAKNQFDCVGKDSIIIADNFCKQYLFLPNAISPNGDGKNDVLIPYYKGNLLQYKLSIFNRWGNKLFETNNPNLSWPQTNDNLSASTYVYYLIYQFEDEAIQTKKSTILVLR